MCVQFCFIHQDICTAAMTPKSKDLLQVLDIPYDAKTQKQIFLNTDNKTELYLWKS